MRAALVLAAGASRRFGRADKLLAPLGRRPLLLHAIACARDALPAGRVLVVVPAPAGRVARAVRRAGSRAVVARRASDGLAASLAAGLAALRPVERELLVFLGDMPAARAPRRLRLAPGLDAMRPVRNGMPGHPLLVRARAARAALGGGDAGLAGALARVGRVPGGPGAVLDLDTPRAFARARARWRRR